MYRMPLGAATWGIDGFTFVRFYAAALATVVIAILLGRRLVGRRRAAVEPLPELDHYEAAMLTHGPSLVASVAVLNLRARGVLDLGDEPLRRSIEAKAVTKSDVVRMADDESRSPIVALTGPLAAGAGPIEQAAHGIAAATRVCRASTLHSALTGSSAVQELRTGLVRRGLLCTEEQELGLRRRWRWFAPLFVVGLARLSYVAGRGRPVAFLIVLLLATVGAMIWTGGTAPDRTWLGTKALSAARRTHEDLEKRAKEPQAALSPAGGMLVGLLGTQFLWSADPALAVAVQAPAPSRQPAGCGGCGGGCGGCGGCDGCGGCGG